MLWGGVRISINFKYTAIIGFYLVITLGIALYYGRKNTESTEDFTVAGRRLGIVVIFFTLLATVVGAASVIGYTGWYWIRGIDQLWFLLGISISYFVFLYYLGPKISEFGHKMSGTTPAAWMEYRYGRVSKYITALLLIVAYLAITAFQYMAMAGIFNKVTGIPYNYALVITAIIVTIYTALGGFWSVASTDVLQGALTLLGIAVLAPVLVSKAGGLGNVLATVPKEHLQPFGNVNPLSALSYTLVFLLGIISWPDIWQRCYAAKDKRTIKKSFWLYIVVSIVFLGGLVLLIGFSGKVLYPGYGDPENILPFMVMDQLPGVFGALIMSTLIAVIMGTADSTLLISAVMIEEDIYTDLKSDASDKERFRVNQAATFIGGVVVLVLALVAPSMFDLWVMSADITGATLAIPILLGMGWKKPSSKAALASISAGFVGWLAGYMGWISLKPILIGSVLSLIAYLVVSFLEPEGIK